MAGEDKGLSIVPMTEELMGDVNTSREPFLVFGRVIPSSKTGNGPGIEELLETQDNNLAACRFYHRCGFVLGAWMRSSTQILPPGRTGSVLV